VFEKWDGQVGGKLSEEFSKLTTFQQAIAEARQGAASEAQLGTAGLVNLGDRRYVIVTGGTSEKEAIVPTGDKYFYHLSKSYENVLNLLYQANVRDAVIQPFAIGGQFNPDFAIDRDVMVWYAGNMLSYHIGEKGHRFNSTANLKNVWVYGYDRDTIHAMCKYCQYRSLRDINELGQGYCKFIRDTVESARRGAASAAALVVLVALGLW
jgi:hypothetical protein